MPAWLAVFLGAGLGGLARHGINIGIARVLGVAFPWSTLLINITGSLLMGLIAGWYSVRLGVSHSWYLFLTTGILGGFTTFSTFSLDAVMLWERNEPFAAFIYCATSLVVALAALAIGLWAARSIA